ncbi:homoserine dehydrogenase [Pontibacter vulgaris]|uniref:homoserine dehydrogenase n=1 Tax=Pontibacter vulgaris TaxID=2905679 RepID=UPI001FA6AB0A|nr:homoserine dehydrogenase [Pontibacter vulgaris]
MKRRNRIKRIGIFGFGCVGQGLYDVLQANPDFGLEVGGICVKDKEKPRTLPSSAFTYNPQDLLRDESIDLLAELISDPVEALLIVRQALQAGKTVVSANKKMIAENLPELVELQQKYNGVLLYEASVCGSIPILRTLEAYYGTEQVHEVSGILNGSSNYILSKLHSEGINYAEALKQAQDLGFAEADPALDVKGIDALNKLCIIAAHAFGTVVYPEEVLCSGIQHIKEEDVALAKALGANLKLVASARRTETDRLELQVLPTFVPVSNELYFVDAEFNGVQVEARFAGNQFLKGRGAGSHPTGSAVWADVAAALAGYKYNYTKLNGQKPAASDAYTIQVYVRSKNGAIPKLPWLQVKPLPGIENAYSGSINTSDLLLFRTELEKAGAFIAHVPELYDFEELAIVAASINSEVEIAG